MIGFPFAFDGDRGLTGPGPDEVHFVSLLIPPVIHGRRLTVAKKFVTIHYPDRNCCIEAVIQARGKPLCLIECKAMEDSLTPNLLHYQKKLSVPTAVQVLHKTGVCKKLVLKD
jgi:hypothetical protein